MGIGKEKQKVGKSNVGKSRRQEKKVTVVGSGKQSSIQCGDVRVVTHSIP